MKIIEKSRITSYNVCYTKLLRINIPLGELKGNAVFLDKDKKYVVHCNKGVSGNAAQNILLNLGFKNVYNLSGGYKNYATYLKGLK